MSPVTLIIYIGRGNIEFIIRKTCLLWQDMVGVVVVGLSADGVIKQEGKKLTSYLVEVFVCKRSLSHSSRLMVNKSNPMKTAPFQDGAIIKS